MSRPDNITLHRLERIVLDGHHRGESWLSVWRRISGQVEELAGVSPRRYRQIHRLLLHLWCCGDLDGMQPIGSAPWERDDAMELTR